MCHLIWQLITGHVAVTRNLTRCHMRCDNYWHICGDLDESVSHATFECPPALCAWYLSATPSSPDIFPVILSIYANIDFWRKSSIEDPDPEQIHN
ncbi:hypothetical protein Bca4012_044510 [Brassica carinata]